MRTGARPKHLRAGTRLGAERKNEGADGEGCHSPREGRAWGIRRERETEREYRQTENILKNPSGDNAPQRFLSFVFGGGGGGV